MPNCVYISSASSPGPRSSVSSQGVAGADGRLLPKERGITFEAQGEAVAYPFSVLSKEKVVQDNVGGEPVVLFCQTGTRSALEEGIIAAREDVS